MEDKEVNTVEDTKVEETKPDNQDFDNNSCFSMCKCASCISACNSEGKKCLRHGSQDMINKDNKDNKDNNKKIKNGDLTNWAKQGVLLLNCALTVRQGKSNSHYKYWQTFTDNLIKYISNIKESIIFVLWGNFAKQKKALINLESKKHFILESTHPSPLSAGKGGWFGNNHFSKINKFLENNNKKKINWHN